MKLVIEVSGLAVVLADRALLDQIHDEAQYLAEVAPSSVSWSRRHDQDSYLVDIEGSSLTLAPFARMIEELAKAGEPDAESTGE